MKKIVLIMITVLMSVSAIVDMEEEVYAPAAEMKMLDDSMNRGIDEQRERNARRPMIMEVQDDFHASAMLTFIDKGKQYILEKRVKDVNHTEIKTKLVDRMLTITEIQKIEEVVIENSVTLGESSTKKQFFESTTTETLQLPNDADEKSFVSNYSNGLLRVTINKK